MGTLNIINCAFDGNENGIFVPGYDGGPGYEREGEKGEEG
jgi:hypothetical protein